MGNVLNQKDLSDECARNVLKAAMDKAAEIGTQMDIAVVDAGANLKSFFRMGGAWLGSIDIAIKKQKPRGISTCLPEKLVN